jgi:hypothetical protein
MFEDQGGRPMEGVIIELVVKAEDLTLQRLRRKTRSFGEAWEEVVRLAQLYSAPPSHRR